MQLEHGTTQISGYGRASHKKLASDWVRVRLYSLSAMIVFPWTLLLEQPVLTPEA